MKTTVKLLVLALTLSTLNSQFSTLFAQGTAFSYQGRLDVAGTPANGSYDLTFAVFTDSNGVNQVGGTITNTATRVTNGLFTVTLDFGPGIFNGTNLWLQIGVETNGSGGAFTTLRPRQQFTSAPYAIQAANAISATVAGTASSVAATNIIGTVPDAQLSANVALRNTVNTFSGNQYITGGQYGSLFLDNTAEIWAKNSSGTYEGFLWPRWSDNITYLNYGSNGFNIRNDSSTVSTMFMTDAGNVGIGTNNPGLNTVQINPTFESANGYGLVVCGAVYGENVQINRPVGQGGIGLVVDDAAAGDASTSLLLVRNNVADNPTNLFDILANGNIGIGTANPAANLDVNGTANVSGGLTVGGSGLNGNGSGLTNLNVSAAQLTSIGNANGSATGNFFVGPSGNATTSGSYNTANGVSALGNNTSGSYNTAIGVDALVLNTSGSDNTAIGLAALFFNTSGSNNTANGLSALENNTSGSGNIALGYQAGLNITGSSNIDIGNPGTNNDNNIIRIGSGQTQTFIAGVINGDGSGLANVALLNGANSFSGNQTVFSGKVGIGTTSPGKLLQVGDGDPTNYTDGMIRLSCAASTWDIGVSVSNMLDFVINDATAGFTRFLIDHNGNVGIGTLPPANTLDVQGSADFYGKVGIGTLTPANTLDVQGSADFSGNVGIGTTNPTKGSLEIDLQHGVIQGYTPVGLLTTSGATRGDFLFTPAPISIWAAGDVLSAEFVAFSDERIKNIKGQSDRAADLQTLLGIKVTDFTYKDTVSKGNRPQKKVIAQQVEQVFPQAVSKSTDVVPDIYRKATLKDGWVQLTTDLKVGDRVKLIGEKEKGVYTVLEVRNGAFRTDFKPSTEQVFVYGREVKDFRNVDYEAIAMLNVSATQELAHKVTKLESSLNQALAEKETLLKRLSVLEERDQAREDRLARMESALEKDSAGVSYVSLKRR